MADGFSYEGYTGPPIPLCHSALHSPSASPFPATYPLNLTRGVFDPMISHGPYRRSLSDRFYTPPYGATSLPEPPPPSSLHVNNSRPGNFDHHRGEDSYTNMLPPQSRLYTPRGTSSDSLLERQRLNQIQIPCGVYDSSGIAFECVNTVFDKSQTSHASLHRSSSVEPVNFNVLLGYGEATGNNVKPLSANPNLLNGTAGSTSSSVLKEKQEGSGVSSLYHTPKTWVAGSENGGVSETSLKNVIDGLKRDEHRSWNHFMVSSEGPSAPTMFAMRSSESCVAVKADNSVNQAVEKTCKLQEQMFDMMSRDKKTDMGIIGSCKGDFPSTVSSTRVSSVVDAMHNLSEVLVYECFSNGSGLKPEQIENLDKVVENLTKCLKKVTGNKTVTGEETSIPSQAVHVSCPNVGDLNEPLDNFGLTEPVDKDKYEDEMTQGIKNILASNFPDDEENHPQTLLYKSLWLETEAALCSTTCMNRYNRIKKEIDYLKLQNREISADASTFMQEPFRNTQKPVSVMNNVEQETTDSLIKHGSNTGNDTVTKSHDAPRSSRFNSDPVNAVLSLMSRSFMGGLAQEDHQNFTPNAATFGKIPDAIQQETHNDVTDRFQILKQQETKRKLKSQKCEQEENPEASKVANIGRSSQMSDVMDRFKILKRREAEKVQRSLNSLDTDSDSDKPRNETQVCDHLWSDSMMTIGGTSVIETCAGNTEEPSASGEGCESPTSDWEHVRKDN